MNNSSPDIIISSLNNSLLSQKFTQREKHYIEHAKLLFSLYNQTTSTEKQKEILEKVDLISSAALENAAKVIMGLGVSPYLYHRHNMLIHGIHVEEEDYELKVASKRRGFENEKRYKQFEISFSNEESRKLQLVPLRIAQKPKHQTPYVYTKQGDIKYYNLKLDIQKDETRDSQQAKRYSGFYFPHLTAATQHDPHEAYFELRINPITKQSCFGNCLFCERLKAMPTKDELATTYYYNPEELVARIIREHGQDVLKYVQYYKIITETFGSEEKCLNYLLSVKNLLTKHGCTGRLHFVGNDIRSEEGINCYRHQIEAEFFAFTVEAFTNRSQLMSRYKGIPMDEVYQILRLARTAGFEKIYINYIEGLDSLEDFRAVMKKMSAENLIDAIGHNIMLPFASFQEKLLVPEAKDIEYYLQIRTILDEFKIKSHHPSGYEKGSIFSNDGVTSVFDEDKVAINDWSFDAICDFVSGKTN